MWKTIQEFNNYSINISGQVRNDKTGRILKIYLNAKGYCKVGLYCSGKKTQKSVHRLVAEAFMPDFRPELDVHHKDGDRLNNHLSNLELIDHSLHSKHHQKDRPFKLNEELIKQIYIELIDGQLRRDIIKKHGIARHHLQSLLSEQAWRHVEPELRKQVQASAKNGRLYNRTTPEIRNEIRQIYAAGGVTMKQLAAQYGVSACSICNIINEKHNDKKPPT